MNAKQTNQFFAIGAVIVLVAVFLVTQTQVGQSFLHSPWWIYITMVGVVFSGFQWLKAVKEEKEHDQEWIEQEGHVYMARIEEARKKANEQKNS